jgi:hypothetical protein
MEVIAIEVPVRAEVLVMNLSKGGSIVRVHVPMLDKPFGFPEQ